MTFRVTPWLVLFSCLGFPCPMRCRQDLSHWGRLGPFSLPHAANEVSHNGRLTTDAAPAAGSIFFPQLAFNYQMWRLDFVIAYQCLIHQIFEKIIKNGKSINLHNSCIFAKKVESRSCILFIWWMKPWKHPIVANTPG